jgi:redox-sensitive bicupin YhaK (pirin superfamily)
MQKISFLPAGTRGQTNIGWLNGFHSFSFGNFYEPSRMPFGALMVLNDDTVLPGTGFGTHSHSNMEIISIPLEGQITHKDSTGHESTINTGEIQVMSAGSGIAHSEYNNEAASLHFLQIWITPNKRNVDPRYQQTKLDYLIKDQFNTIVSPDDKGPGVWIHQNAWISLGEFQAGALAKYQSKDNANGIYFFLLEGEALIGKQGLRRRDAMAVTQSAVNEIRFIENAILLVIEVPLAQK